MSFTAENLKRQSALYDEIEKALRSTSGGAMGSVVYESKRGQQPCTD